MKYLFLLFLVSCASQRHLTETDTGVIKLINKRCVAEYEVILKANNEFTTEFCRRYLPRIAPSQDDLNNLGSANYTAKFVRQYNNKSLMLRTMHYGTIQQIQELPFDYARQTAFEFDDTVKDTREFFYQKEIDNRIKTKEMVN